VKAGEQCVFIGQTLGKKLHECKGGLQAMHGIGRSYHSTRWNLANGFAGCAAGHTYMTYHPQEWDLWLARRWGTDFYLSMWASALAPWDKDLDSVLNRLQNSSVLPVMQSESGCSASA
jgi:hypothetical protein